MKMKTYLLLAVAMATTASMSAQAASMQVNLLSSATTDQAQAVQAQAQAAGGRTSNIVRDPVTGKIASLTIALPDNASTKATQAIANGGGVATTPTPVPTATPTPAPTATPTPAPTATPAPVASKPEISTLIARADGLKYLFFSDDLGASFSNVLAPTNASAPYAQGVARSGSTVLVMFAGPNGNKLMLSKDKGATFSEVTTLPADTAYINNYDVSGSNVLVYLQRSNGVAELQLSKDAGATFSPLSFPTPAGLYIQSAIVQGAGILLHYSGPGANELHLSKDLGASFGSVAFPYADPIVSVTSVTLAGNQVAVQGQKGADWSNLTPFLTISENSGASFAEKALPAIPGFIQTAQVSGSNILFEYSASSVHLSKDGGASYNQVGLPSDTTDMFNIRMK